MGANPPVELLPAWKLVRDSRKLDETCTERMLVWTDPQTGLQVHCTAIEYADFPTVEWTLHFKNPGPEETPILSDIQAVDLQLACPGTGEFVLNHLAGDNCTPESYEPRRFGCLKSEHRFAPAGGRPRALTFRALNLNGPARD